MGELVLVFIFIAGGVALGFAAAGIAGLIHMSHNVKCIREWIDTRSNDDAY